jgi:hypothetical protein
MTRDQLIEEFLHAAAQCRKIAKALPKKTPDYIVATARAVTWHQAAQRARLLTNGPTHARSKETH